MEKTTIKLYHIRTFGEKISDTFDFVRENWRPLLKYLTYLMLPISLVETFISNTFLSDYMEFVQKIGQSVQNKADTGEMLSWIGSMALMGIVQMLATMLLEAIVYTMMQQYEQRQQRLQGITAEELRPGVLRMFGRQFILLLAGIVVLALFVLIAVPFLLISPAFAFPFIVLLLVGAPLFVLVSPIYLFERETGIVKAYTKSIRLGWNTWAGIVGVGLVLYIITSIISSILTTPYYIMTLVKELLTTQATATGFVSSFGYSAIQYVLGAVSSYCGNILMSLLYIGLAYQYGHACEKIDGVTVDQDIENFETLNDER